MRLVQDKAFPHEGDVYHDASKLETLAAFGIPKPELDNFDKAFLPILKNGHTTLLRSFLKSDPLLEERIPQAAIAIASSYGHFGNDHFSARSGLQCFD